MRDRTRLGCNVSRRHPILTCRLPGGYFLTELSGSPGMKDIVSRRDAAKQSLFVTLLTSWIVVAGGQRCAAQYLPNVAGSSRSPVDIPQTNLQPIAPPSFGGLSGGTAYTPPPYTPSFSSPAPPPSNYSGPITAPPSVSLGSPLFDPYSTGTNPGTFSPAVPGSAPASPQAFPGWLPSANSGQSTGLFGGLFNGTPASGTPTFGPGNPGFGNPSVSPPTYGSPYSTPTFPSTAYPANSPNTLFPGGLFSGGTFAGGSGGAYNSYRLFQGPRLRHAWISDSDSGDAVEMHDTDASLVFAFPNFLYSGQPVYVAPSFGLHLLDGPNGSGGADLPPQLYDAFLDTGWQSDPTKLVGADVGLRVGVFSDFDAVNSESLRVIGKGLVTFRLTPYTTVKAGVYYLDRNRVKLLPAGGVLYQPTAFTRYDFFFPQPKLSQYFTTLGTQDLWAYVGGDYGGGAWTIKRTNGEEDNIDINDIRLLVGLEWGRSDLIRAGRHTGFVEAGFVFDREVLYKENSQDDFTPGNTFMLRLGFGY